MDQVFPGRSDPAWTKAPEAVLDDFTEDLQDWKDEHAVEWETLPMTEEEFERQEAELAAWAIPRQPLKREVQEMDERSFGTRDQLLNSRVPGNLTIIAYDPPAPSPAATVFSSPVTPPATPVVFLDTLKFDVPGTA